MIDANQVWEVDQAIDWVNALAFAEPGSSRSRPAPTT
jgi:L-alanine-DL-glutamate epimerase-like enolase superfamily enzyme